MSNRYSPSPTNLVELKESIRKTNTADKQIYDKENLIVIPNIGAKIDEFKEYPVLLRYQKFGKR